MTINRPAFFSTIRTRLIPVLDQGQVDGCNALLDVWEQHYADHPDSYLAYALATADWETGHTFRPVEEVGHGAGTAYGRSGYWGRGYVQLTWEANYAKATQELKQVGIDADLVADPDKALDPVIAGHVLYLGMIQGWFTGRKLADYIPADPVDARRIINGLDQAETIGGYYGVFVEALRVA